MNRREFMRIYNNFYVFLELVVRRGRQCGARARQRQDLGCVEGGSEVPGRDSGGILGASREVVGSRGEMVVGDAGEKHI
jgi:hypothetical protein